MSDLIPGREIARQCQAQGNDSGDVVALPARQTQLGNGLMIYRALPLVGLQLIGPWCFLDHFGPLDVRPGAGLRVGPHPHIGLQTVTWLLTGELLHRDSLGMTQRILPGQLNLMTSGNGIAHSEESPADHAGRLHGVQLWVALPEDERLGEPRFDHYPELPLIDRSALRINLLAGESMGLQSPARVFSPLVGLDIELVDTGRHEIDLNPDYEHGLLVLEGRVAMADHQMDIGTLFYLPVGRSRLELDNAAPARALLIGGPPFPDTILMWWNLVARTPAEITAARNDWEQGRRFGTVTGYDGERIAAPRFDYRLKS